MDSLEGKVALVTGAGSGMGRATAELFLREGSFVIFVGRTLERLTKAQHDLDPLKKSSILFAGDISDRSFVDDLMKHLNQEEINIDILVNAAGVIDAAEEDDTQIGAEFDKILDINVKGMIYICTAVVADMIKAQKGGAIVNIASIAGHFGNAEYPTYAASKGAVLSYTKSLASKYGKYGIRANSISPGVVLTPMSYIEDPDFDQYIPELNASHKLGRIGRPVDIANAVFFFSSQLSEWITGQDLIVDGGFTVGG